MPLFPPQSYRKTEFIHRIGLAAARPAAADVLVGTLYFSTDTLVLERSDGTVWSSFSPSPAVNSVTLAMLAQVATQTVLGRSAAGAGDVSALTTLPNTIQDNITRLGTIILGFVTNAVAALTTAAESWIGPSSTTGIYFKGGRVGIGTTDPTDLLDVNGVIRIQGQSSTSSHPWRMATVNAGVQTNKWHFQVFTNGFDIVETGVAEHFFIKPGGNVGIGTTNPLSMLTVAGLVNLKAYTVGTLPAAVRGDIAYVTDALAPTFLAIIVGGGAVVTPVFFNGTNWVGF